MIFNAIVIIVIIAAIVGVILYYKSALNKDLDDEEYISQFSLSHLTNEIAKVFADTQKENLSELNLTKKELEAAQEKKRLLRTNLQNASYGDPSAKRYIKSLIKSILQDEVYGLDQETINAVIPFNQPHSLDTRAKLGILFHLYYKVYDDTGFLHLCSDYNLTAPKEISLQEEIKGALKYDITKEDIDRAFDDVMEKSFLTYDDKLEIVTQRIFEDYKGFGIIDSLFDFAIDEIQGGTSGVGKGFLEVKPEQMNEHFEFSYDSIWIVFKGRNIKLSCMSFGSQDELVRVAKNIYRFQANHALSRNEGHIVATMRDGSRAAVARPPECSSWAFCCRKFDTVSRTPTIKELFPEEEQHNNIIIETLLMYAVYTQLSLVVSGGMGDGKTTTLRTIIGFLPSDKSIRVYELSPELNAESSFPQRNIKTFAMTETTTVQELFDFGKKFSANVSIVSEIATADMGVVAIESGRVASEQMMSTHHATSTVNLISAVTDNMTSKGGYSDVNAAEEVVVNVIKLDVHMARKGGMRYIERITEVRPIEDRRYPSEKGQGEIAGKEDTREYYARQTDRRCFEAVDICRFSLEDNSYHMVSKFSDALYERMCNKLIGANREQFIKDMEILYSMIGR